VRLTAGQLEITDPESEVLFRPIDVFFDSLATELREKSIGIVLSGTGTDGALGLKAIKACGGLTLAQGTTSTAPQYPEMPAGAIATGSVDLVTPVEEMPAHLMRLCGAKAPPGPPSVDETERLRLEICTALRNKLGHDFSGYRSQTFWRRVERRMQVLGCPSFSAYVEALNRSSEEATLLFRDLLIRVTRFFRDSETFAALESKVIPLLFSDKHADSNVRVWVPGCATGEEAYSLAILIREYVDRINAPPKVQIFATDIDDSAISVARLGRYPASLVEGISPARLARFFTHSHGGYVVSKEIRNLCTFSMHNLVRDPPFSMMSLVSCRNLLIYMNNEMQARIIPIFHYALVPDGVLLLGSAESAMHHTDLFTTLDKAARIFQRRHGRGPAPGVTWNRNLTSYSMPQPQAAQPDAHPGREPTMNREARDVPLDGVADVSARRQRFEHLLGALDASPASISALQAALSGVLDEHGSLAEQYQTALEELRSANEELHSVNEEMQSTNEELETSKEELQSVNEELHTVNIRLTDKIAELDRSNSDLRNLFDSTEIATVFLDRHLIIRSFTPAIATLYNLIPSDQGRPLTDIVNRVAYGQLRDDVATVLATLEPLERRVTRTDTAMHYIMRILPYRDPDSTVSGVLVTFIDVTSIVQAEDALKAADVRKDVFLATLSHELRNPLAPIRTAAQVLVSPKLSPEDLVRVQAIISRQVTHMSALLDDLLDVSRITRGSFLLKKAYVSVDEIFDEAVEAAQPVIDRRKHTLRVDKPSPPITLEADRVRMTQVLTNLLTNAAKYTPTGGLISAGARVDGTSLLFYVRDNGVGLAPEARARVFEMFTQVESQIGRSEGGLGIGLALSKGLIELHGGRIEVRSDGAGKGSEFIVYLPSTVIVDARGQDSAATDASAPARRVLIVEDHPDGAEMMRVLLSHAGHHVEVCNSSASALELARKLRPAVAVIDIGMPELDGYQIAQKIRSEAWGNGITLVAVTGWGSPEDKGRALAAGFDFHMTKPVDPHALKDIDSRPAG